MNSDIAKVQTVTDQLLSWMEHEKFSGWDPFDGLNSPFLKKLSYLNRWLGVFALQIVKRSPLNLRPVLRIPKTRNAKGFGIILSASLSRYKILKENRDLERAIWFAEWLESNISPGYRGACWGYPFDWPNRSFFAPEGTPTIVNTAFIGHAFLDLYDITQNRQWYSTARSACDFISQDLRQNKGNSGFCFSYAPIDNSIVHNANLLGASLLARTGKAGDEEDLISLSLDSTNFSLDAQENDGSWYYGDAENQRWIDSFHTGYNLLALKHVFEATGDTNIKAAFDKGYKYYIDHFFMPDGSVKYYHNDPWPLDAHAFAHAIICLAEMKDHPETPDDLIHKVVGRMLELFWSGKGYFYWKQHHGITYRLPCMRWVEAWILLALVTYLSVYNGYES